MLARQLWDQLKSLTADELAAALERDGWIREVRRGAVQVFKSPTGHRVTVHYHPNKTYGPGLLKALLADIGWDEDDLRRLRLVK